MSGDKRDRSKPADAEILDFVAKRVIRDMKHLLNDVAMGRTPLLQVDEYRARLKNFEEIVGDTADYRKEYHVELDKADMRAASAEKQLAELQSARTAAAHIKPPAFVGVMNALVQSRCYACGWPLGSCKPFDCGMRFKDGTEQIAERENWLGRAKEMADVWTWIVAAQDLPSANTPVSAVPDRSPRVGLPLLYNIVCLHRQPKDAKWQEDFNELMRLADKLLYEQGYEVSPYTTNEHQIAADTIAPTVRERSDG